MKGSRRKAVKGRRRGTGGEEEGRKRLSKPKGGKNLEKMECKERT